MPIGVLGATGYVGGRLVPYQGRNAMGRGTS